MTDLAKQLVLWVMRLQRGNKSYGLAAALVALGVLVGVGYVPLSELSEETKASVALLLSGALAAAGRAAVSKVQRATEGKGEGEAKG